MQAGKTHTGHIVEDELNPASSNKLSSIRIWHSEFVEGIEFSYGGISMGAQKGKAISPNTVMSEIVLDPDEFIEKIEGACDPHIYRICFTTTKGKILAGGLSQEGNPFTLNCENCVAWNFKYEVTDYLNCIGVIFGKSAINEPIMGAPVMPPITFIEPILYPTNNIGNKHGDTVQFDDFVEHIQPMLKQQYAPSLTYVKFYWDGNYVTGYDLKINFTNPKGETVSKEIHRLASKHSYLSLSSEICLEPGEGVTKVTGGYGAIIDRVELHTNLKGLALRIGGNGGGPYELMKTGGNFVVCFAGGMNGHLHNISAYYI